MPQLTIKYKTLNTLNALKDFAKYFDFEISENVAKSLAGKFGISHEQASGIVQSLIPKVMGALVTKTNDPNDKSFDLKDIIGSLSGGKGVDDLLGGLKKMF